MVRLEINVSNILLDSRLTCRGSDSKASMQTGRIVYHIKFDGHNYSGNDMQGLERDQFITPR